MIDRDLLIERAAKALRDKWYPPSHVLANMAWPGGKDFWLSSVRTVLAAIEAAPVKQEEIERLRSALQELFDAVDGQPLPGPEQAERIEAAVLQAFRALHPDKGDSR